MRPRRRPIYINVLTPLFKPRRRTHPRARSLHVLAAIACLLILSGCAVVGPASIRSGRQAYNEAVQQTTDQELLLNIVRLRYRDTPTFLQISGIATQMQLQSSFNASTGLGTGRADNFNLSQNNTYAERPTISYRPVVGQAFIQQLLEPVTSDKLTLLYNAGWPVDTLFSLVVQSVNGLQNAPGASGPTPELGPEFDRFQNATRALRDLQRAGLLNIGVSEGDQTQIRIDKDPFYQAPAMLVRRSLNLSHSEDAYQIDQATDPVDGNTIAIVARSLMSTMFFLAQGVDVPDADIAEGRVFTAQYADGQRVDWHAVTQGLFRVHASHLCPEEPYVSVQYRGRWYAIYDNDLSSKTTFALLSQLFAMQSGNIRSAGPVLTLPVGG